MPSHPSSSACLLVADLLVDYADQVLSPEQTQLVAAHLPQCAACCEQVAQLRQLSGQLEAVEMVAPPSTLRPHFLQLLEQEKIHLATTAAVPDARLATQAIVRPMWTREVVRWGLRIAAGVALLLIGLVIGQKEKSQATGGELAVGPAHLSREAVQLTNALSGNAAQRLSASDRIQLVNSAGESAGEAAAAPGAPVVQALINTLNFDPNANVRLAAASALYHFRADPRVGVAFTQSLSIQTDPNVQILLIELLVNMHERGASAQLQQLAREPDALPIVRQQAEYGLGTLL